jgi:hypothetical protein
MANDLDLLLSFVDGQGAGAGTYVTYAEDMDTNFTEIQTQFNSLNAEVRAFAGNNATIVFDLTLSDSPALTTGIFGVDSFQPIAFITGDTQIQVPRGVALTAVRGRIVSTLDPATLTGSGVSGARFINLDADGTVTLETATLQGEMDLFSVNWNGASFDTGTLTRLEEILVDGDDFQGQRIQEDYGQGSSAAIPGPYTYDSISHRIDDIVRIMGAELVSAEAVGDPGGPSQAALNPMAFGGTAAAPGLILGDGAVYDAASGLFGTPGSNSFGLSILGTAWATFLEVTANEVQARVRGGTLLAEPPISIGDPNTGIGYVSSDIFRLIAGSLEGARIGSVGGVVSLAFVGDPDTGSNPGLAVIGDLDTGLLSTAADFLQSMTGGVVASQINAVQQRTSATQGRSSATRSLQNVATGTALTAIVLNTAEQYDQGTYHDLVTNPDRMTIPTSFDGVHQITATCSFDESTSSGPNVGDRDLAITLNGAVVARSRAQAAGANDTDRSVSVELELVATDIVRMAVAQDSGGAMDVVNSRLTVRLGD